MIKFREKTYALKDYEGMDFVDKRKLKKFRNQQAKKLQEVRKANNALMPAGGARNAATSIAQDVARKSRDEFVAGLRKNPSKVGKYLKRGTIGALGLGAAVAGGYGLKKIYDENKEP